MRRDQVEERARAAEVELRKTVTATSSNATDTLTLLHSAFDNRRRVQEALALAACADPSTSK